MSDEVEAALPPDLAEILVVMKEASDSMLHVLNDVLKYVRK